MANGTVQTKNITSAQITSVTCTMANVAVVVTATVQLAGQGTITSVIGRVYRSSNFALLDTKSMTPPSSSNHPNYTFTKQFDLPRMGFSPPLGSNEYLFATVDAQWILNVPGSDLEQTAPRRSPAAPESHAFCRTPQIRHCREPRVELSRVIVRRCNEYAGTASRDREVRCRYRT